MSGWRNTLYWSVVWILGAAVIVFWTLILLSIPDR